MNAQLEKRSNAVATGMAATAALAVACGVCCVLPVALPAIALGAFGGAFAWFGRAHAWVTWLATLCVAAGWLWVVVQSRRTHRRTATKTYAFMAGATFLLFSAWLWPLMEPSVIRWLTTTSHH